MKWSYVIILEFQKNKYIYVSEKILEDAGQDSEGRSYFPWCSDQMQISSVYNVTETPGNILLPIWASINSVTLSGDVH